MNSNIFDNFTKTYLSKISSKRRITFQNTMANNTLSNAISGHFRLFNQLSCAKIASGLNLIRLSDENTLVSTLTFFRSNQYYKRKPVHENYILYNLKGYGTIALFFIISKSFYNNKFFYHFQYIQVYQTRC